MGVFFSVYPILVSRHLLPPHVLLQRITEKDAQGILYLLNSQGSLLFQCTVVVLNSKVGLCNSVFSKVPKDIVLEY